MAIDTVQVLDPITYMVNYVYVGVPRLSGGAGWGR